MMYKIENIIKKNKFYSNLYSKQNVSKIINKQILKKNINEIIQPGLVTNIIFNKTTGTTGESLTVLWKKCDYINSNIQLWKLRNLWYNINIQDRFCQFSFGNSAVEDNNIYIDRNKIIIKRKNYSFDELTEIIEEIMRFDPVWIQAPISIMLIICDYKKKYNMEFKSLKYIELNGEYSTIENIRYLENEFNIKVGNLYGAIEFNGVALMCPNKHFHILDDNVFVESDNDHNLIISSLTNTYMPILKYVIGDLGYLTKTSCCYSVNPEILVLERGRSYEVKKLTESILDYKSFNKIIKRINEDYGREVIQQYFITDENDLVLNLVISSYDYNNLKNKLDYYSSIDIGCTYKMNIINIETHNFDGKYVLFK